MIRLMVVDDDPLLIDLFQDAQSFYGFEVVGTALDGMEALKIYPKIAPRPDIVIMDQRMPNMCGTECTRNILRMDPLAKIVFVSAEVGVKDEALSAGAVAFMEKPFPMKDLMETLGQLLDSPPLPL